MEKENKNEYQIELVLSPNGFTATSPSKVEGVAKEIMHNVAYAVSGIFEDASYIQEIDELLKQEKHVEAFTIVHENEYFIINSKNKKIYELVSRIDYKHLVKKDRKHLLAFLIHLTDVYNRHDDIDKFYQEFENEFKNEVEQELWTSVLLCRANSFSKRKLFNIARQVYGEILSDNSVNDIKKGFCYRGLSKISLDEKDKISYSKSACEMFLQSGERIEVVKELMLQSNFALKNANPNEALRLIEEAETVLDNGDTLNTELCSGIYSHKARILLKLQQKEEAAHAIDRAYEITKDKYGNLEHLYGIASFGKFIHSEIGNTESSLMYSKVSDEINAMNGINNNDFLLYKKILDDTEKKNRIDSKTLKTIEQSGNKRFLCEIYIHNAVFEKNDDSMLLLDKAIKISEELCDHELSALAYFGVAEIYREDGKIEDAYLAYSKSLHNNVFQQGAYQNCLAMLVNNQKWDETIEILEYLIDKLGAHPNMCFILGKSFYHKRNYNSALKYFKLAPENLANDFIMECAKNLDETIPFEPFRNQEKITLECLRKALTDFSLSIKADSRMTFWKSDKNEKHKWCSCPEEHGKHLLISFLNGKFGKDRISILQEVAAGAGIIDLYLLIDGHLKVVIELKMCGSPYSSSYAKAGCDQLLHYLDNSAIETNIGILIVFDGRKRDFSKGFKAIAAFGKYTLYSYPVDVRPEVSS